MAIIYALDYVRVVEIMIRIEFCVHQETRETISVQKTAHKHTNKDLSSLRSESPGIRVNTRYINSTRGTSFIYIVYVCVIGDGE